MALQTEYSFKLPKGYVDSRGGAHFDGVMRLATAADEIEPLRDPRVRENEAYLTVVILSRVVTKLGTITNITPQVIEGMFTADLAYLQDVYSIINFGDPAELENLGTGGDPPLESSPPSPEMEPEMATEGAEG